MCQNLQLFFAVVRIGIYSLFRRITGQGPPPVKPTYNVLCLGLTKSGKSSLLSVMGGDKEEEIQPTVGFSIKALMFDNCFLDVKELGGGDNVRPFWDRYYLGSQGIIYVVDSSSSIEELDTSKIEFQKCLNNSVLDGLPVLLLANCQDKKGARTPEEIGQFFDAECFDDDHTIIIQGCSLKNKDSIAAPLKKLNDILIEQHVQDDVEPSANKI